MKQLMLFNLPPKSKPFTYHPKEWKVVALRECVTPLEMQCIDTPEAAVAYWHEHITKHPYFDPEVECLVTLLLNVRRRIKGHHFASIGTNDCILVHPREVFRVAAISAASALVLAHNHPSGDPSPSEADIKVTRDLIRAGQILKIEVLDHIIVGKPSFVSLRALGYFYS